MSHETCDMCGTRVTGDAGGLCSECSWTYYYREAETDGAA
jgi:hypothetical protein